MSENEVRSIGEILNDPGKPLSDRFRALFTLRNLGGVVAVTSIAECFKDSSALLKHELAYCLGQMQDERAIPFLIEVLEDDSQETIVRHEAGEALGAIGSSVAVPVLQKYQKSPIIEIAETCELALFRIEWLQEQKDNEKRIDNPFSSVDPAPPCREKNIENLERILLDQSLPLFQRYRAIFSLRNMNTAEAAVALAKGFKCSGALFRHEIAYVLGQMQNKAVVQQLLEQLSDKTENAMVRHECAEALGSIAEENCLDALKDFLDDSERVVRESCEVALDMLEYEQSGELHYANGLIKVRDEGTIQAT